MKPITVSLFALCLSVALFGQESKKVVLEETIKLNQYGAFTKLELHVPIPDDYAGRQRVEKIDFKPRPKFMATSGTVRYAVFEFGEHDLRKCDAITMRIELTLFDFDLTKALENPAMETLKKRKRKGYLANRGLYELGDIPPEGVLFENSAFGNDKKQLARAIHTFVEEHLQYRTTFGEDKGALFAYENRRGDCTEYADLMIALCRANQLPARRVSGYTIKQDTTSILSKIFRSSGHAWVEVYFDDLGWVPFDPTHSDGSYLTSFENLENKYVYLQFNDWGGGCHWTTWGYGKLAIEKDRRVISVESIPDPGRMDETPLVQKNK